MRFSFANPRWLFSVFAVSLVHTSVGHAQAVSVSATRANLPELASLYRLETPAAIAPSAIRFLRLLPDGRSRIETVRVDLAAESVRATVSVESFSRRPWRLKTLSPGASPQLCFELGKTESCSAFHMEMPRGDLLLFSSAANWGAPTLILRREAKVPSR